MRKNRFTFHTKFKTTAFQLREPSNDNMCVKLNSFCVTRLPSLLRGYDDGYQVTVNFDLRVLFIGNTAPSLSKIRNISNLTYLLSTDYAWLSILLYISGKLCSTVAIRIVYIYTSELFPTYTRNTMHALCSALGRVAAIIAPQTPLLVSYLDI